MEVPLRHSLAFGSRSSFVEVPLRHSLAFGSRSSLTEVHFTSFPGFLVAIWLEGGAIVSSRGFLL